MRNQSGGGPGFAVDKRLSVLCSTSTMDNIHMNSCHCPTLPSPQPWMLLGCLSGSEIAEAGTAYPIAGAPPAPGFRLFSGKKPKPEMSTELRLGSVEKTEVQPSVPI
jgi:hypothetical protein